MYRSSWALGQVEADGEVDQIRKKKKEKKERKKRRRKKKEGGKKEGGKGDGEVIGAKDAGPGKSQPCHMARARVRRRID